MVSIAALHAPTESLRAGSAARPRSAKPAAARVARGLAAGLLKAVHKSANDVSCLFHVSRASWTRLRVLLPRVGYRGVHVPLHGGRDGLAVVWQRNNLEVDAGVEALLLSDDFALPWANDTTRAAGNGLWSLPRYAGQSLGAGAMAVQFAWPGGGPEAPRFLVVAAQLTSGTGDNDDSVIADVQLAQAARTLLLADEAARLAAAGSRSTALALCLDAAATQTLEGQEDDGASLRMLHPAHELVLHGTVTKNPGGLAVFRAFEAGGPEASKLLEKWLDLCSEAAGNLGPLAPSAQDPPTRGPFLYWRAPLFHDAWRWRAHSAARRLVFIFGGLLRPLEGLREPAAVALTLACAEGGGSLSTGMPCPPSGRWSWRCSPRGYAAYRQEQEMHSNSASESGLWRQHFSKNDITFVAEYISRRVPLRKRFGLCHGTRSGYEQHLFELHLSRLLRRGRRVRVLGTELSEAALWKNGTVRMDFHLTRREWRGGADFAFSNSLDHALSPLRAVSAWMDAVAEHGVLILEHTYWHTAVGAKGPDVFGASLSEYVGLIESAGAFRVAEVLRTGGSRFLVVRHLRAGPLL